MNTKHNNHTHSEKKEDKIRENPENSIEAELNTLTNNQPKPSLIQKLRQNRFISSIIDRKNRLERKAADRREELLIQSKSQEKPAEKKKQPVKKITSDPVITGLRFQKKKKEKRRITKILDETLEKSGLEIRGDEYQKQVKKVSIIAGIIISLALSIGFEVFTQYLYFSLGFLLLAFVASASLAYMLILVGSFIFLDYKIYTRTKEIEEVLPEFLQLASANISAGMPIDRALWFAVRPKFGILAKEIEEVAKSTIAGEDLEEALEKFTNKYDSKILKESMSLLIEGMRAGGEIGFLLNQISSNMQDIKIMRKEIAASVMSYVIFITAASIIGAPALLALSSQLLVIMSGIASSVDLDNSATSSSSSFKISLSADSISIADFKIFATIVLLFTSVFSAMIISTIRKGNANESIKVIPGYLIVSLIIFFAASALFASLMSGVFQ